MFPYLEEKKFDISFLLPVIEKAEYIYNAPYDKDDWDDAGSIGYTKETVDKAISFLCQYAEWIFKHLAQYILMPKIFPGRDGGVDFLWNTGKVKLLLRLNKAVSEVSYSAEDQYSCISEGTDLPIVSENGLFNSNIFFKIIPPVE